MPYNSEFSFSVLVGGHAIPEYGTGGQVFVESNLYTPASYREKEEVDVDGQTEVNEWPVTPYMIEITTKPLAPLARYTSDGGKQSPEDVGTIRVTSNDTWQEWLHRPRPVTRGRKGTAFVPATKRDALTVTGGQYTMVTTRMGRNIPAPGRWTSFVRRWKWATGVSRGVLEVKCRTGDAIRAMGFQIRPYPVVMAANNNVSAYPAVLPANNNISAGISSEEKESSAGVVLSNNNNDEKLGGPSSASISLEGKQPSITGVLSNNDNNNNDKLGVPSSASISMEEKQPSIAGVLSKNNDNKIPTVSNSPEVKQSSTSGPEFPPCAVNNNNNNTLEGPPPSSISREMEQPSTNGSDVHPCFLPLLYSVNNNNNLEEPISISKEVEQSSTSGPEFPPCGVNNNNNDNNNLEEPPRRSISREVEQSSTSGPEFPPSRVNNSNNNNDNNNLGGPPTRSISREVEQTSTSDIHPCPVNNNNNILEETPTRSFSREVKQASTSGSDVHPCPVNNSNEEVGGLPTAIVAMEVQDSIGDKQEIQSPVNHGSESAVTQETTPLNNVRARLSDLRVKLDLLRARRRKLELAGDVSAAGDLQMEARLTSVEENLATTDMEIAAHPCINEEPVAMETTDCGSRREVRANHMTPLGIQVTLVETSPERKLAVTDMKIAPQVGSKVPSEMETTASSYSREIKAEDMVKKVKKDLEKDRDHKLNVKLLHPEVIDLTVDDGPEVIDLTTNDYLPEVYEVKFTTKIEVVHLEEGENGDTAMSIQT
uniref:Uncharacterized protein n=1 Tax=Branchiostoma floridae TaxID=7739 RepID=C3YGQ3_BRAFL|eukprot:XP_002604552.1 hypothetical protein BRAFLDRAFT_79414 [Branchiostoma floridae]